MNDGSGSGLTVALWLLAVLIGALLLFSWWSRVIFAGAA
jgi:hypothetical protein